MTAMFSIKLPDGSVREMPEGSTPADVAAFAAAVGPVGGEEGDDRPGTHPGVGTFAGIPYDVRPPTVDRLKRAWWNPASDRLWSPRVFGAGWDLNAGALAVRLGLIEPDAEDEPFTHTPDAARLSPSPASASRSVRRRADPSTTRSQPIPASAASASVAGVRNLAG